MKIVIDIPEETYKGVLEAWEIEKDSHFTDIIHEAIVYSQPYEDRPTENWIIDNGDRICPICNTGTSRKSNASVVFFHYCPYCGTRLEAENE